MNNSGGETVKNRLYPLDSAGAEVIFAPFHDPLISRTLPLGFKGIGGKGCRVEYFWCWTRLIWDSCPAGSKAGEFELPLDLEIADFDAVIVCLNMPSDVSAEFELLIDGAWTEVSGAIRGTGTRVELELPVKGRRLGMVRARFSSAGELYREVLLIWLGLRKSRLVNEMIRSRIHYDHDWHGLIKPYEEWGGVAFKRGLLFDAEALESLRNKSALPGWKDFYDFLEQKAKEHLQRVPERDIGEFLPSNDIRFVREHDKGKSPFYFEALLVGFVGLVNRDRQMMVHAMRYLMSMVHTANWTFSPECRLPGSSWDVRCFMEEMATSSVCLLADWYAFALTDSAMELIYRSVWDKGLSIVDRDMMKLAHLPNMNQGSVFCRARILGGLLLEQTWPHMDGYTDRALSDMKRNLSTYMDKDGGVHEGIAYLSQTFQATLQAFIAYSRCRGQKPIKYLKKYFGKSQNYVAAMSGVEPGTAMLDGDCRTNYFSGDFVPVLAGFFPGSVYERILSPCLRSRSVYKVAGTLTNSGGILGFVYGPEVIEKPKRLAPTFAILKNTGHLASYRERDGRSTRIHFSGAKGGASHSHFDKGAVVVEFDGKPALIDRGMVEYWYSNANELKLSRMHNVITPISSSDTYLNQALPMNKVLPRGKGDNATLRASVDLSEVWHGVMVRCSRKVISRSLDEITIVDEGEFIETGRIAFHLHSTDPFTVKKTGALLETDSFSLQIDSAWHDKTIHRQESINFKHEPVYHMVFHSHDVKDFSFETRILRTR